MNDIKQLKPILISELETYYCDFIEFKHSTGLKYTGEVRALNYFARYCREHYTTNIHLPENAIYDWINEDDNRSIKTKSNYCGIMTSWAKYMFSLGYIQMRIPEVRCPRNTAFVPHIFTTTEIEAIWNTVDHIAYVKRYPNLHRCIPVLFRLLYSCGLRISEALSITKSDIDFERDIITLRKTKNDKERCIPMCSSIAKVLKKYIMGLDGDINDNHPIFYYRQNIPLTSGSVYGRFRLTLQESGIPYEGILRGPRLHDFRHTFAVTTMNRLCDEGNDMYVSLPVLSAYLGHTDIKTTERYIRLTEERLSKIIDSIQLHIPDVFPEVKEYEEF